MITYKSEKGDLMSDAINNAMAVKEDNGSAKVFLDFDGTIVEIKHGMSNSDIYERYLAGGDLNEFKFAGFFIGVVVGVLLAVFVYNIGAV